MIAWEAANAAASLVLAASTAFSPPPPPLPPPGLAPAPELSTAEGLSGAEEEEEEAEAEVCVVRSLSLPWRTVMAPLGTTSRYSFVFSYTKQHALKRWNILGCCLEAGAVKTNSNLFLSDDFACTTSARVLLLRWLLLSSKELLAALEAAGDLAKVVMLRVWLFTTHPSPTDRFWPVLVSTNVSLRLVSMSVPLLIPPLLESSTDARESKSTSPL
mmetsp:Transcript_30661/g.61359  ORF Transcript_30661/g.61359 Transcript_30661/m.61359 type:complete len:215 (-) Transcript_30661:191-835(-)